MVAVTTHRTSKIDARRPRPRLTLISDRPLSDSLVGDRVVGDRVVAVGRPRQPRRAAAVYRRRRLLAVIAAAIVAALVVVLLELIAASFQLGAERASAGTSTRPVAMQPAAQTVHVVQPGDTLWSIAADIAPGRDLRATVDRLVALNDGAALQVGQRVVLP